GAGFTVLKHRQGIARVNSRTDQRPRALRFEEPPARRRVGRCPQVGNVILDEAGVDAVGDKVGVSEYGLEERQLVGHALDSKLAQRTRRLSNGSAEVRRW